MTSSNQPVKFMGGIARVDDGEPWDHKAALEEALRERDLLLKNNPELQELQNEIDELLSKEDRFEQRMIILGKLIGEKLSTLHEECEKLEDLCHSVGIHTKLPITQFKRSIDAKLLKQEDEK